jgi:hypothetical protein
VALDHEIVLETKGDVRFVFNNENSCHGCDR